jgi:DNA-binding MarR family transcriptional regulator
MSARAVLPQVSERGPAAAPARSVRRATARRASTRRSYARARQSDSEERIIAFLTHHPGSTIGDLAKHLDLDPDHVSSDLAQLARTGEITKESHGYIIPPPGQLAD